MWTHEASLVVGFTPFNQPPVNRVTFTTLNGKTIVQEGHNVNLFRLGELL